MDSCNFALPFLLVSVAALAVAPQFLNDTSEAARLEFRKILADANLTKAEMRERVHRWAGMQSDSVEKAVHRLEREQEIAHDAMRENALAVIRKLETVISLVTAILDDASLTRRQTADELRRTTALFDDDAVAAVRMIMRNAHRRVSKKSLTRQISEPCHTLDAKYDLPPALLTVQGLPTNRQNYMKRQLHQNLARSSTNQLNATTKPQDEQPPEGYMRYLSNLSTVTINNGREFRNFEMSRRGTPTSTITARRRTREGELPPEPSVVQTKPQSKCKRAFAAVLSKHRLVGLRHFALALVLIAYWLGGMMIFHSIESAFERQDVEETRHALNEALLLLGRNLSIDPFLLKDAYLTLLKIDGKYEGSTFYKLEERDYQLWTWSYGTAFFYSYTLFTTIGYGSISPSTDVGRGATIIYAIIGFPLALVIIRDIGSVILVYITRGYAKIVKKIRSAGAYSTDQPIMLTAPICSLISLSVTLLTALFVMAYDSWLGPDPGVSYFHAFYFTFISYAAIGLGDLMPNNYPHAPLVAIVIVGCFPLMRVVNRVLYVGVENTVYRIVTCVEEKIDRFAPGKRDEEMVENVENCPTIEVDLCPVDEVRNEEEDEDDRIHDVNNVTVRSSPNEHRHQNS